MQDLLMWVAPEADAETRCQWKYLVVGNPRSGRVGRWDREGKEANNGAWYLVRQDTSVGN